MSNPYSGLDFFSFLLLFFQRFIGVITGKLPLATDEIQIFVLAAVALSGALVGTFLILREMTMLANALSHTILLGIVSAYLLLRLFGTTQGPAVPLSIPTLLIAAFTTGIATTFLTQVLSKVVKLQEDASIGLVFSILFSLGIVLITLFFRNVHIGTELVMGNVDALQPRDLRDVLAILGVNSVLFILLFNGFKITTFDPQLARTFGFSPLLFNYLLMIQTSATAIGAFRAVGVLMILAFFVIPPLTARLLTHTLSTLIGLSCFFAALASLLGVALSRHLLGALGVGLSTSGLVVIMLGLIYLITASCSLILRAKKAESS